MEEGKRVIVLIVSIVLLFTFILATRVDATTYSCNTCASCSGYLSNATTVAGDIVQLNTVISLPTSTNPTGFAIGGACTVNSQCFSLFCDQVNHVCADPSGTCIDFGGKKGVTFDCQSFSNYISGTGNASSNNLGIYLNSSNGGSNNDTVRNCYISNFYYGIKEFSSSANDTFSNLNLSSNNVGLIANSASNNTFLNLFLFNNSDKGIYLSGLLW